MKTMNEVKSINYKYLVGAANVGWKSNSYSGSVSMNPDRHNAFDEEFKYKYFLKETDGGFRIIAQCYIGNVSFENIDPEKIQELDFEGSDEGMDKAREWLQGAYDALMNNK